MRRKCLGVKKRVISYVISSLMLAGGRQVPCAVFCVIFYCFQFFPLAKINGIRWRRKEDDDYGDDENEGDEEEKIEKQL